MVDSVLQEKNVGGKNRLYLIMRLNYCHHSLFTLAPTKGAGSSNPISNTPLKGHTFAHLHLSFSSFLSLQRIPKDVAEPAGKYYPAEDVKTPKKSRRSKQNPPKVRDSITAGTVLILLAGRFRGKRVVCLKALESGLLLVSGPYKVNGVPLRRVNSRYVIATSTKVDVSGVDVASFNDAYFARVASSEEEEFFAGDEPKPSVASDERKADQKKVDESLLKAVESVPLLKEYLKAKFSLSKNDKPHKMKF